MCLSKGSSPDANCIRNWSRVLTALLPNYLSSSSSRIYTLCFEPSIFSGSPIISASWVSSGSSRAGMGVPPSMYTFDYVAPIESGLFFLKSGFRSLIFISCLDFFMFYSSHSSSSGPTSSPYCRKNPRTSSSLSICYTFPFRGLSSIAVRRGAPKGDIFSF